MLKRVAGNYSVEQCEAVGPTRSGVRCRIVDRNTGNEVGRFLLVNTAAGWDSFDYHGDEGLRGHAVSFAAEISRGVLKLD